MDVASGATDVPIPRINLKPLLKKATFRFWILASLCFLFLYFSPRSSNALIEGMPIHFSGDKQIWDRRTNQVELFGNAAVSQPGETLTADYIHMDLNARTLDAR